MAFKPAYRPLDHTAAEIRLVKIFPPASGKSGLEEPLQRRLVSCQIEHFRLEDINAQAPKLPLDWGSTDNTELPQTLMAPRYPWGDFVALSYTWGETGQVRPILVNGRRVMVRSNLEAALRVLSERQPIRQGILVWIDALCIDQDDVLERNREVKRMRTIYKTARDVVVWLGEEQQGSREAMKIIQLLAKACEDNTDNELRDRLNGSPAVFGAGTWRALGQLFSRAYWERMWIIQEISMGNSQTPIFCGNEMVTWGEIHHAIYTFSFRNGTVIFTNIERECKGVGLKYQGLNRNKIIHFWQEQQVQAGHADPQYMPILDIGRKSLATDPRDKIYGLLGLLPKGVAHLIEPDYGQEVNEVYRLFAKAWIDLHQNLEILEQCTAPRIDMPSWVPDWTNREHFRLFSGRFCYQPSRLNQTSSVFNASGTELSVNGLLIGEVDGLGASYYETSLATKPEECICQPTGTANAYGSSEHLRDAIWRTLVGNRTPRGHLAPEAYSCLLDCPLTFEDSDPVGKLSRGRKAFAHLLHQNKQLRIAGTTLGGYFPSVGKEDPEASSDAFERIFRLHRSRRLVITNQGHFGLVPIATQQGDLVFILQACNIPMILRRHQGQRYQVVGGCYIQGFMEQEVTKGLTTCSREVEIVVLF